MFTGIVAAAGSIRRARQRNGLRELEIEAPAIARELHKGDSVAVDGVCLSAVGSGRRRFTAQVVPETLARTTLSGLRKGGRVNLELPARFSDRIGGHIVQGHVDGVARVVRSENEHGARRLWLSASEDLLRYMVRKGSVALDGVSLTVVQVGRTSFEVALIPHTLETTTLGERAVGAAVNLEVDVVARYVERLVNGALDGHR
jgi:riboflavin synthase